jgi:hypothetical protein
MQQRRVQVRIDDRARLLSAILAATSWPDDEQTRKPHGVHAHARGTRRVVSGFAHHPAVHAMQTLLDKWAPLEAVYTYVMRLSWPGLETDEIPRWVPPKWNEQLKHFYEVTNLAEWWAEEEDRWSGAKTAAETALDGADFYAFLEVFIGPIAETLMFIPNICYPTDTEIGVRRGTELCCLAPPRIAWGSNPPWPFDEDPAHVLRAALSQYGRLLLLAYLRQHADALAPLAWQKLPITAQFAAKYPTFNEQFAALFVVGAVGLFLERTISKQEAKAYVLMRTKAEGVTILPGMVSVLGRYLEGRAAGRWNELIDYLPHFPRQLRVAKTITTL